MTNEIDLSHLGETEALRVATLLTELFKLLEQTVGNETRFIPHYIAAGRTKTCLACVTENPDRVMWALGFIQGGWPDEHELTELMNQLWFEYGTDKLGRFSVMYWPTVEG